MEDLSHNYLQSTMSGLMKKIKDLNQAAKNNENLLKQQQDKVKDIQIVQGERNTQPLYVKLADELKKKKKRLKELNFEVNKRQDLVNVLIKTSELQARSKGNLKYEDDFSRIWKELSHWESVPDIVKTKLDEQENEIALKKARLDLLNQNIEEKRRQILKLNEKKISSEREKWETEWSEMIEKDLKKIDEKFDKEKRELEFKIRMCEISLFKNTAEGR